MKKTIEQNVFKDERGFNMKFFQDFLAKEKGFGDVKEVFATTNKKGTIRAFHYQGEPNPQQKIVKPLSGRFNVRVIDMENNIVEEFNDWNNNSEPIFVKAGNMLGYVALEDNSVMLYIADEKFYGDLNFGVSPFSFGVDWGFSGPFIMSERDELAERVSFKGMMK